MANNPPRSDATNLTGITSLMNHQFMDKEKDPDEIERKVMGQLASNKKDRADPVKIYTREMEILAEDLNINLTDGSDAKKHRDRPDSPRESIRSRRRDNRPDKNRRPEPAADNIFGVKEENKFGNSSDKRDRRDDRDDRSRRDDRDRTSRRDDEYSESEGSFSGSERSRRRRNSRDDSEGSFSGSEDEYSRSGDEYSENESDYSDDSRRRNLKSSKFEIDDREDERRQRHRDRSRERSREQSHRHKSRERSQERSGSRHRDNNDWMNGREIPRDGHDRSRHSDSDYNRILRQVGDDFNIDVSDLRNKETIPRIRNNAAPYDQRGGNSRQEISKNPLDDVLRELRNETVTEYAAEREDVRDRKSRKLEEIAQLKGILHDEGVDVSTVHVPTLEDSEDKIDSVLKILRLKNDRIRYSSLAEEMILGAAECIETVLDGTREIPVVGWKPDYTDYHNTVSVKLHRMRFETSQLINDAIQGWKLGPMTRIAVELLPSFFLYPRQRSKQRGNPGLYDELNKSAYNGIRSMDDHKSMSDIARI